MLASLDFIPEPLGVDSGQRGVDKMALVMAGREDTESLWNSQESVALVQERDGEAQLRVVTVTMKITGSEATRKEGRYQCFPLLLPLPSSLPGKYSFTILLPPSRENLLSQVLKNQGSIPALFPHLPNKSCSIWREHCDQRNLRTL